MKRHFENFTDFIHAILSDIKIRPIYWITMMLALMGAFLSSDASSFLRGFGFFLWIFSNGYMLKHFYDEKNSPMILMFFFYEIFNIRGVINNWMN